MQGLWEDQLLRVLGMSEKRKKHSLQHWAMKLARGKRKKGEKKKKHSVLLNRMVIAFLDSYVMETLWFSQSQWNSETVVLASVLKDQQKKK